MLKLNDDKTECIVFKSKHNVNTFTERSSWLYKGGDQVPGNKEIFVTFDHTLSMQAHVNTIAKTVFII